MGTVTGGTGSNRRTLIPEYRLVTAAGTYQADGTLTGGQPWTTAAATYGGQE